MRATAAFPLLAGLFCYANSLSRAQTCPIVNLMPTFWKVAETTAQATPDEQIRRFREQLVQRNGDLYASTGIGFNSDHELDSAILDGLAEARSHPEPRRVMSALLQSQVPLSVDNFRRTFADFQCDFPIYLAPALGKLDGAGRTINHKQALVIGVDNAAAEYTASTLPIFLTHELFHRYHFQVAGFSDDEGDREVLWRALWVEGLATYVSMRLNPGATLQDALILPHDLIARAQPQLGRLIDQITPHLDQSDPVTFEKFFEYHKTDAEAPSRVGYYMGALVAQRLAENTSLSRLAHLQAATARERVLTALQSLSPK